MPALPWLLCLTLKVVLSPATTPSKVAIAVTGTSCVSPLAIFPATLTDTEIRFFWHRLYLRLVNDLHLHPESEAELDERLGDTREGWLKRADPATTA